MTTQEEFFQQHAVDGVLPEHLMTDMLMLSGGGDTPGSVSLVDTEHADSVTGATGKDNAETGAEAKTVEKPGDGKTDPVVVPPKDEDLNADNAVILAKDGKHTIGFEKLEQERTARRAEHFEPIYQAHPNMDSMLESTEFTKWVAASRSRSYARASIENVLKQGTSAQVIEVFDSFKKATRNAAACARTDPAPAPAADAAAEAARKAAEAVAAAKNANRRPASRRSREHGRSRRGRSDVGNVTRGASPEVRRQVARRDPSRPVEGDLTLRPASHPH
jgi:hypothetical protein